MAIGSRSYARGYVQSGGLPPGVKWLLAANVLIFLVQLVSRGLVESLFALQPSHVIPGLRIWELVTYLFLHGDLFHILFNMLALWFLGKDLEATWGTERFLQFYFFCGVGAGLCVVALNYLFGTPHVATIGASGAIYGLFLAAAILWPEREMIFFFFPVKMKYFVMIIGAIALYLTLRNPGSGVSNIAHLGGMLFAYAFMRNTRLMRSKARVSLAGTLREQYREWKMARARRKFQVYMKKQNRDHLN